MAWTGTTEVPVNVQGVFDQTLHDFLPPDFDFLGWGEQRNVAMNSGTTLNVSRPNLLSPATTPIPEYITPEGAQFSTTDMTVALQFFGNHVPFSRRVTEVGLIRDLTGKVKDVLAVNRKDTCDQVGRDILVAGTQARLANGSLRTDINTILDQGDLDFGLNLLARANAKPIAKRVLPGTGVATTPLNKGYIAIGHIDLLKTLSGLTGADGWKDVASYAKDSAYPNEYGATHNGRIRYILNSSGKIWAGGGAGGGSGVRETGGAADVYALIIMAEKYYCETRLGGKTAEVIVQPLGSSGSLDPYKQRGSIGWYGCFTVGRLDNARCVRIECAAASLS
jgi:N4-gp56 family major capsid protein